MTDTETLADFLTATDDAPAETAARAKLAIRDYLGVALAATAGATGETLRAYGEAVPVAGPATVLNGTTAGHERAVLFNGTLGHALDYDDTFASFPLHPTTVVVPALLAASELDVGERDGDGEADADGRRFLRAYVLGVETLYRVGKSVFPRQYDRGFHSTGAVGPLGAAAAVGVLLGFDREQHRCALGIAASSAGGLRRNFGTTTKPLHAGFAASAGLRAALLALNGATADLDVLDGVDGYGAAMAGDAYDPSALSGNDLTGVDDLALKLYPSAHITHGMMEALGQLRAAEGFGPDDIASVRATIHPAARDVLIHDRPDDALQAKFSAPFCLAATLRTGDPGLAAFTDEFVAERETRDLLNRMDVAYDANAVADLGRYGGRVAVELHDGTVHDNAVVDAPGSPCNPVAAERLREKFDACLAASDAEVDADSLAVAVANIEDGSVADVLSVLRGS